MHTDGEAKILRKFFGIKEPEIFYCSKCKEKRWPGNEHHYECCPKKDCNCVWYDSNGEPEYAGRDQIWTMKIGDKKLSVTTATKGEHIKQQTIGEQ